MLQRKVLIIYSLSRFNVYIDCRPSADKDFAVLNSPNATHDCVCACLYEN